MGLHACRSNTTFATHHRVLAPPVRIGTTCTGNRRHTGRQEFLILHTRSRNAPITIPRECTRFSTYARHIPRLARLPGSLVSVSCSLQIGNCSASISSSFLFHPRSCHPPPGSILLLHPSSHHFDRPANSNVFNDRDELSTSIKASPLFDRRERREESLYRGFEYVRRHVAPVIFKCYRPLFGFDSIRTAIQRFVAR